MKSKYIIIGVIFFLLSLSLLVIGIRQRQQTRSTAAATGPLRVNSVNPRYFADASGKPVYLTGAYDWNFAALMADSMASDYLNYLVAHKQNFIRVSTNDPTFWQTSPPSSTPFDDAYFHTLKTRVAAASAKGIYVAVQIFQHVDTPPFDDQAYNEAYARHIVDMVGMFDNVLYEVGNELNTVNLDKGVVGSFSNRIVNVINEQQAARGFSHHPVGISDYRGCGGYGICPQVVTALLNGPADFIQPGWSEIGPGTQETVPDYGGKKVIIPDSDHLYPYHLDHHWVWKTFARGNNPSVLDGNNFFPDKVIPDDPTDSEGAQLTYDARLSVGDTRSYALRMDLERALPSNSVSSTGYALAHPGVEYLVYQPDSGSFTVTLGSGNYAVEWFNPTARQTSSGGTINGGGTQTFTPPFSDDAVLYLKNTNITGTLTSTATPTPTAIQPTFACIGSCPTNSPSPSPSISLSTASTHSMSATPSPMNPIASAQSTMSSNPPPTANPQPPAGEKGRSNFRPLSY